jgi:transposase-like protein
MTNDDGRKPEGAPERSPKAGMGAPSGIDGNGPKRFSVQRKMAIVARLLRGEPLELVARETNVSIARLTEWRERALAGAATAERTDPFRSAVPIDPDQWFRLIPITDSG